LNKIFNFSPYVLAAPIFSEN